MSIIHLGDEASKSFLFPKFEVPTWSTIIQGLKNLWVSLWFASKAAPIIEEVKAAASARGFISDLLARTNTGLDTGDMKVQLRQEWASELIEWVQDTRLEDEIAKMIGWRNIEIKGAPLDWSNWIHLPPEEWEAPVSHLRQEIISREQSMLWGNFEYWVLSSTLQSVGKEYGCMDTIPAGRHYLHYISQGYTYWDLLNNYRVDFSWEENNSCVTSLFSKITENIQKARLLQDIPYIREYIYLCYQVLTDLVEWKEEIYLPSLESYISWEKKGYSILIQKSFPNDLTAIQGIKERLTELKSSRRALQVEQSDITQKIASTTSSLTILDDSLQKIDARLIELGEVFTYREIIAYEIGELDSEIAILSESITTLEAPFLKMSEFQKKIDAERENTFQAIAGVEWLIEKNQTQITQYNSDIESLEQALRENGEKYSQAIEKDTINALVTEKEQLLERRNTLIEERRILQEHNEKGFSAQLEDLRNKLDKISRIENMYTSEALSTWEKVKPKREKMASLQAQREKLEKEAYSYEAAEAQVLENPDFLKSIRTLESQYSDDEFDLDLQKMDIQIWEKQLANVNWQIWTLDVEIWTLEQVAKTLAWSVFDLLKAVNQGKSRPSWKRRKRWSGGPKRKRWSNASISAMVAAE